MPSEMVKKQLSSLEFAIPDSYNKETNTYHIPQYRGPYYRKNGCYIVLLNTELFNKESKLFDWGNTRYPRSTYLKISVDNIIGKLIHVDGFEYDENGLLRQTIWSGWLHMDYIQQIQTLE